MSRTDPEGQSYERSYFRVRCTLPLRMRRARPEEIEALASEIVQQRPTPDLSSLDPDVASWLDRIEQKLDRILVQVGADDGEGRPTQNESLILSGGGIRMAWGAAWDAGETLLIEFELPGATARLVRCLGRIIDVYEEGGARELGISFHAIHAQDREAIVQHTLSVERDTRRSRNDEDRVAS